MVRYVLSGLASLSAALLGCQALAAAPITITTEDYPPYNYTADGKITGLSTEIVQEVMKRAGLEYKIENLPWKRAYGMALEQADTCVYSTTMTDERKPLFKWVGPLATNDWTFFAMEDTSIALTSLEDAKAYNIGGYQGDALADFLQKQGFKVETAPQDAINPKKLAGKRIDLWATGSSLGPYLAKQEGVSGLKPLLSFNSAILSLACNKGMEDEVLAKMQGALDAMKADGGIEAIAARYR